MPCVSPLDGWLSRERTQRGKRSVVFEARLGFRDRPVSVPCGRCIGCRVEYARQWAMRCMHEASLYDENSFVTLTYDDDHLPARGSLRKRDFQLFMKRLRRRFPDQRIRFFASGEYGDDTLRPHYHGCLFGFDFRDKRSVCRRSDYEVYQSDVLDDTWACGLTEVGSVTFDSAAYCARYAVKKFRGKPEDVERYYDGLEPEFAVMSRRPGIGAQWYAQYGEGVRMHDSVIVNGREVRPPKYYDALFEAVSPRGLKCAKAKRMAARERFIERDGRGDSRLLATQDMLESKQRLFGGSVL